MTVANRLMFITKAMNTKRICELNNITWQMNPDDFKQKKGSTYFGSVQVSKKNASLKFTCYRVGFYRS